MNILFHNILVLRNVEDHNWPAVLLYAEHYDLVKLSNSTKQQSVVVQFELHYCLDTTLVGGLHLQLVPTIKISTNKSISKFHSMHVKKLAKKSLKYDGKILTWSWASNATKSFSKPSCLRISARTELRSRPLSSGKAAIFSVIRASASATSLWNL